MNERMKRDLRDILAITNGETGERIRRVRASALDALNRAFHYGRAIEILDTLSTAELRDAIDRIDGTTR